MFNYFAFRAIIRNFACNILTIMSRWLWIVTFCLLRGLVASAQETIELTGEWEYSVGDSTHYNDYMMLPGALRTDEKVWFRKGVYLSGVMFKIISFLPDPLPEHLDQEHGSPP